MRFHCDAAGLHGEEQGHHTLISRQPIELVSVSNIDKVMYVKWPAEHSYHHLAVLPKGLVDRPSPEAIRDWADHQGYQLRPGQELRFADFLNQQMAAS